MSLIVVDSYRGIDTKSLSQGGVLNFERASKLIERVSGEGTGCKKKFEFGSEAALQSNLSAPAFEAACTTATPFEGEVELEAGDTILVFNPSKLTFARFDKRAAPVES